MNKIWSDLPREDLSIIDFATSNGWNVNFEYRDKMHGRITPNNVPQWPVSFSKNNVHVWKAGNPFQNVIYWRVADLIDKHYCNHRSYANVKEALNAEMLKF